jgi:hypothetical protein
MPRILCPRAALSALSALLAAASSCGAAPDQDLGPALDLKPGQEIAVPVAVAGGRVTLGRPRLSRPGAVQPKEGEIVVSVIKHGLSPYADLAATEKTAEPVDFVATGLIGDIKIDEVVLCGRLDGPATARIASGSWRVSLNRFSVRPNGQEAPAATGEGGLRCPK